MSSPYVSDPLNKLESMKNCFKGRMSNLFVFNRTLTDNELDVFYKHQEDVIYEKFYEN